MEQEITRDEVTIHEASPQEATEIVDESDAEKKPRVRRRSASAQLQEALDDARRSGLTISSQKLIQARLEVLGRMVDREQETELKTRTAENAVLKAQHDAGVAELAALRQRVTQLEARTPEVRIVPDPDHATLRQTNEELLKLMKSVASQYGDESERMQAAIRSIQSSTPAAAAIFCDALGVDHRQTAQNLLNYKTDAQLYDIVGKGKVGPLLTFARAAIAIRNANTLAKMSYTTLNPAPRNLEAESEEALRKVKTESGVNLLRPVRVDEPRTSAENLERQEASFVGSPDALQRRERVTPAYVQPQREQMSGGGDWSDWVK
jgi:hypothetical protein